jgi:hypothetical protein
MHTGGNNMFMPAWGDVKFEVSFFNFSSVTWDSDALRKPKPS